MRILLALSLFLASPIALAQVPSDPAPFIAAQREALAALTVKDNTLREVGDRILPDPPR